MNITAQPKNGTLVPRTLSNLNIRNIPKQTHRRFSAGAALEGVTQAEFLRLLMDMWEREQL